MTSIDPHSKIEIDAVGDVVAARIPLVGPVTGDWMSRYRDLARASGTPAEIRVAGDRAWLVVTVPAEGRPDDVAATMDEARRLIASADASADEPSAPDSALAVRQWWSGVRSESRVPIVIAIAVAVALELLFPQRFSLGPKWVIPAIQAALLVAVVVADHVRVHRRAVVVRASTTAMVAVVVADAAGVTVRLITDLIEGGPETNSPAELLGVGFGVWIYTIIAFTFLYWIFDGGGPSVRATARNAVPDLAFPQHLNRNMRSTGWRATFGDYLYLGFTNATAFSPTDVMPLARWAKFAMAVQAATSLAVLGLVIARAVNILK
ncbi:MAG TPA: hypothetical protein VH442_09260 [Micromonosporaceae bacterium]